MENLLHKIKIANIDVFAALPASARNNVLKLYAMDPKVGIMILEVLRSRLAVLKGELTLSEGYKIQEKLISDLIKDLLNE